MPKGFHCILIDTVRCWYYSNRIVGAGTDMTLITGGGTVGGSLGLQLFFPPAKPRASPLLVGRLKIQYI